MGRAVIGAVGLIVSGIALYWGTGYLIQKRHEAMFPIAFYKSLQAEEMEPKFARAAN